MNIRVGPASAPAMRVPGREKEGLILRFSGQPKMAETGATAVADSIPREREAPGMCPGSASRPAKRGLQFATGFTENAR